MHTIEKSRNSSKNPLSDPQNTENSTNLHVRRGILSRCTEIDKRVTCGFSKLAVAAENWDLWNVENSVPCPKRPVWECKLVIVWRVIISTTFIDIEEGKRLTAQNQISKASTLPISPKSRVGGAAIFPFIKAAIWLFLLKISLIRFFPDFISLLIRL